MRIGDRAFTGHRDSDSEPGNFLDPPERQEFLIDVSAPAVMKIGLVALLLISSSSYCLGGKERNMTEEDEVLNFIEIFMRAVPSDTFLDPRELQCVLGIEVSNWTSLDMNFPANTGVNMKAVNIRSRSAKGLTTNVRLFKEIYPGIRYVLDVADGVEGYIFSVNGLAEKCCISREAIESKIGKPDEEFPAPHGQLDFAGHGAYSFVTSSSGKKSADFHYVWLKGRACLNAFGAGLRPNR